MALRALQGPAGGSAPVGGSGTTDTIPRWTGPTTLGDSGLIDDGSKIYATSRKFATGTNLGTAQLESRAAASDTILRANAQAGFGDWAILGAGIVGQQLLSAPYAFVWQACNPTNTSQFPIALNPSGGNVGIGTASPQDKTQVFGNLKVGVYASGSFISLGDEGTTQKNVGIFRGASVNELQLGGYGGIIFTTGAAQLGSQTERMRADLNGNVVINTAAIATNATNGFLYVPSCAGTPTGTPTTYTGRVPIVVDTTNHKLYFYSGGSWRDAGP